MANRIFKKHFIAIGALLILFGTLMLLTSPIILIIMLIPPIESIIQSILLPLGIAVSGLTMIAIGASVFTIRECSQCGTIIRGISPLTCKNCNVQFEQSKPKSESDT